MVTHKGAATASGLEEIPRKQSLQTTKFIVGTSARGTRPHLFQCVKFRKQARCVCCEALVLVLHAVLKTLVWKFKMADQRCQPVLWGNHPFLHNFDFVPFVFVIQTPFTLFKPQPGSGNFFGDRDFLKQTFWQGFLKPRIFGDRDFWRQSKKYHPANNTDLELDLYRHKASLSWVHVVRNNDAWLGSKDVQVTECLQVIPATTA